MPIKLSTASQPAHRRQYNRAFQDELARNGGDPIRAAAAVRDLNPQLGAEMAALQNDVNRRVPPRSPRPRRLRCRFIPLRMWKNLA
jgi:hypothetical protein